MEIPDIECEPRSERGTRQVRRLRNRGFVPCVLYGREVETRPYAAAAKEIEKALKRGAHLVTLVAPDGSHKVLIKHVQYDHVGERILHVDFHKISLTELLEIEVPVVFKGTPVGVSQEGGVFVEHVKVLKVKCLPESIPDKIEVDISGLKLHDKMRLKDLKLPQGAQLADSPERLVAGVMEPKVEEAPAAAEAAAPTPVEPEVIKKGKKEEEGATPAEKAAKPEKAEKAEKK
jgi:large subunit ribosomal protein L25